MKKILEFYYSEKYIYNNYNRLNDKVIIIMLYLLL